MSRLSGRAIHGAPPQPLSLPVNAWPTELRLYNPADLDQTLNPGNYAYSAPASFNATALGYYLTKHVFVQAVLIEHCPYVINGYEYVDLAIRHGLEAVLVQIEIPETRVTLKHVIYLHGIGPSLPGAPNPSPETIYDATVKQLNSDSKVRLFRPDVEEIAAARAVMYDKTAYQVRARRKKTTDETVTSLAAMPSSPRGKSLQVSKASPLRKRALHPRHLSNSSRHSKDESSFSGDLIAREAEADNSQIDITSQPLFYITDRGKLLRKSFEEVMNPQFLASLELSENSADQESQEGPLPSH